MSEWKMRQMDMPTFMQEMGERYDALLRVARAWQAFAVVYECAGDWEAFDSDAYKEGLKAIKEAEHLLD